MKSESRQEYTFTNVRTFCNETVGFPVKNLLPGERASVGGLLQIQRRGGTLLSLWHCTFEFSVSSITLHRGFCRCAICWGRQGIAVRLRGLPVTLSLSLPGEKEEKSGMNMSTRYLQHSPITICHSFISCYQGAFAIRSSDPTCGKASQRRPLHRPPPLSRFEKSSPITQVWKVLPHYPGLKSPPPLPRWKKNKLPR